MNRMQAMRILRALSGWLIVATMLAAFTQPAAAQRTFDTPEAAAKALVAAAKADDEDLVVEIFGARYRNLIVTSDKLQDSERLARFARAAAEYQLLRAEADGRITLLVGADAWPLPIPLVKSGAGWQFDDVRIELLDISLGAGIVRLHRLVEFGCGQAGTRGHQQTAFSPAHIGLGYLDR